MPPKKKQSQQQQSHKNDIHQQSFILYKLLEVQKTATTEQIKKSYKKLVLKVHPDKNKEDSEAKQKFNKLNQAYKLLIDPQKRMQYDQTGKIGDQFDQIEFETAYQYFRNLYKKIETKDIQQFEIKYRGGAMQEQDLINYYNDFQGDMELLLENIPLSRQEDIGRFLKFYEEKVQNKELKKYKNFQKTKTKIKRIKFQDEEVKKVKQKENNQDQTKNLVLQIRAKKHDFISILQQKYGKKQPIKIKEQKKQPRIKK